MGFSVSVNVYNKKPRFFGHYWFLANVNGPSMDIRDVSYATDLELYSEICR